MHPDTIQATAHGMNKPPSDLGHFLGPLIKLALRFPEVEGVVIWAQGCTWHAQDDTTELLDAEEIAFYAEGLLLEGFGLVWQAMASRETPARPETILLFFWRGTQPSEPLQLDPDWIVLQSGQWQPPE